MFFYWSILPVADISIPLFGSQVRVNNIIIQDTRGGAPQIESPKICGLKFYLDLQTSAIVAVC